jgi:lysophospholipase L1-like esterase
MSQNVLFSCMSQYNKILEQLRIGYKNFVDWLRGQPNYKGKNILFVELQNFETYKYWDSSWLAIEDGLHPAPKGSEVISHAILTKLQSSGLLN